MRKYGTYIEQEPEQSWTSPRRLYLMRPVTRSSRWIITAEASCLRAFPAPDPRDGEVLAARHVPRAPWRNDHTWVRCSLHGCHTSRHRPADAKRLAVFLGTLASKGHTAAQRTQAPCAVDSYSVCLSPEVPSLRHDDAVAPTAPNDGDESLAARTQERVSGPSPRMEAPAHVLVQATGASAQTHAAW